MNRIITYCCLALTGIISAGCIEEYDHPGLESLENLLVVEGFITGGETTISISRSVSLDSEYSSAPANPAVVSVETESGLSLSPYHSSGGTYYITTGELDPNTRYRLKIELDGETYASEFLVPLSTPPIDTMVRYKRSTGRPVEYRISTLGEENDSPYYLWAYQEIWEIKAHLRANAYQINPPDSPIVPVDSYTPYYYCWKYNRSNSLLLGSTVKLNENRIADFTLFEIDPTTDRLDSELYWIRIRQNSLRPEAHTYFSVLKTNVESTGSIFGVVPSEMKGNIACLSDPDIPVIGYVEVTDTQWKDIFMERDPTLFENKSHFCPMVTGPSDAEEKGLDWLNFAIYEESMEENIFALKKCVDCRQNGGSKSKPAFWPNDHE